MPPPPLYPLTDDELLELDTLLAGLPAPWEALDLAAVDGFIVGTLLQPRTPAHTTWLPFLLDENGAVPPLQWPQWPRLEALLLRHARVREAALAERQWFDPWLFDIEEDTPPEDAMAPWVLGFAAACTQFPALTDAESPELNEALAQIYQYLDPEALEDAEALIEEIESLEPPSTLEEAVESVVRGSLLLADISRPRARPQGTPGSAGRPRTGGRPGAHRTPRRPAGRGR